MSDPVVSAAVMSTIVALLLLIQTWAQEKKRKIETESAREKQAEANATKVVEKLTGSAPITPLPPIEERVTPKESPIAKGDSTP